ncbi:MAG: hypothetical protein L3V56_08045 [Candidatus Magnetoovum sp. WYHC-5]|nr:hypothetical protein [Candidatus Magnetoovum sp. WYHC-5]
MSIKQMISLCQGGSIRVEGVYQGERLDLTLYNDDKRCCMLHWGFIDSSISVGNGKHKDKWVLPPKTLWPAGSTVQGASALQTPFDIVNGANTVSLHFTDTADAVTIIFVLYYPEKNTWDNNKGKNYKINIGVFKRLPEKVPVLIQNGTKILEKTYRLNDTHNLKAIVYETNDYVVDFATAYSGLIVLHWAIAKKYPNEWQLPPESMRTQNSVVYKDSAVQTPFSFDGTVNRLRLNIKKEDAPSYINFVVLDNLTNEWFKDGGRNFSLKLTQAKDGDTGIDDDAIRGIADDIINHETGRNSWTLMHRMNLCHDMLDRAVGSAEALAVLYVWLRYSEIRQLTWQKNYNTKPRELSHAQERFTLKVSRLCGEVKGVSAELLRLILGTVGPGGDGQRVRDEILNIMHRHKIKEVLGHFMEEWHQKLHNNTTYDDVVICEAFLEFQKSNGDLKRYYDTLMAGGITKERLAGFERPIRSDPHFVHHLKDGLIRDFEYFLKVLKNVHSATDLERASKWASYLFNRDVNDAIGFLMQNRDVRGDIINLIKTALWVRINIKQLLQHQKDDNNLRNLLYLDLAIKQYQRTVIESSIHFIKGDFDLLLSLTLLILENMLININDEELQFCFSNLKKITEEGTRNMLWALKARSAMERIARYYSRFVDGFYKLLQPKAEYLGVGFGVNSWTIEIFSEEVVRGFFEFALASLLRYLDGFLRQMAALGDWQLVSHIPSCTGTITFCKNLQSIQNKTFTAPVIIITPEVNGEEEIPLGVRGIITTDVTDIVSHISVRARNSQVLFATCYNPSLFDEFKTLEGKFVSLVTTANGDVVLSKDIEKDEERSLKLNIHVEKPTFTTYAILSSEFSPKLVGGKSNNLFSLKNKLPSWMKFPKSVAIPFGVCEYLLKEQNVQDINKLVLPNEFMQKLRHVMEEEGLGFPADSNMLWQCIKDVWVSKWNERAIISRKKYSIPDEAIYMAVLIQALVDAKYSYVIHTVNPFNKNKDEIYFEAVPGLGQTLVGNYPGRAFGFICKKASSEYSTFSFLSKSTGLFGDGIIVRSDSNGEDLQGYAGAGLYESVYLKPLEERTLDYKNEPLFWDEKFKEFFVNKVREIALTVEDVFNSPQDIEGAYDGDFYIVQTRPQV